MRIITLNCNGIRAAHRKGFLSWLEAQNADVICLQETKAQIAQLDPELAAPPGWHAASSLFWRVAARDWRIAPLAA
jgi:exodeoxyribonuclease-3